MKKVVKINEQEISKIVKKQLLEMFSGNNGTEADPNAIIDEIGSQIEPICKKLADLWFIYREYENSANPMLNLFMKRLKTAYDCISGMEDVYNH